MRVLRNHTILIADRSESLRKERLIPLPRCITPELLTLTLVVCQQLINRFSSVLRFPKRTIQQTIAAISILTLKQHAIKLIEHTGGKQINIRILTHNLQSKLFASVDLWKIVLEPLLALQRIDIYVFDFLRLTIPVAPTSRLHNAIQTSHRSNHACKGKIHSRFDKLRAYANHRFGITRISQLLYFRQPIRPMLTTHGST